MTRRFVSPVMLLIVVLAPHVARAQGQPFGKLMLSIGQGYDDNLFASPASGNLQSDFVTRFGPIFEGGYQSPALTFLAHYGFDAERYIERVELDNNVARQEAIVDLKYRPGPRLALQIDGSYLDTQTPRELNLATLISAGRARAQRTRGHSGAVYDASAVMKVNMDYELAQDTIVGGLGVTTQTSQMGVSYRPTPRSAYRSNYRFAHMAFRDGTTIMSAAVTGGWAREFTPFVTFEIDAGPRISSGSLRPELAAQLKRRLRRGEVLVAYFTTEDTVFGETGTIQVRRLMGTFTHTPMKALTLRLTPAAVHSLRDTSPVSVYELSGDVTIRANSKLAFVASGHFGQQNGTFNGAPDRIPYRGVSINTIVTLE